MVFGAEEQSDRLLETNMQCKTIIRIDKFNSMVYITEKKWNERRQYGKAVCKRPASNIFHEIH
jgi:hypothetical protein